MTTKIDQPTRFDVLLGVVKAVESADSAPRIICTASSDEIDLGVDRFTLSALNGMAAEFPGMTIFLNHKYAAPEDVFGVVAKAVVIDRGGHHDLDLEILVDVNNDRAMVVYRQIQSGVRLGVSVGVLVEDAEFSDQKIDGKKVLNIKSVKTLEASIVGIPANRRSWVQGALKAASAYFQGEARELLEKLADSIVVRDGGDIMSIQKNEDEIEGFDGDESTGEIEQEGDEVDEFFVDAVWTRSYINDLSDSAFATILAGGEKDAEGKTKPRSLRKLPHHDSSGAVDEAHLNNALSREPQTKMPSSNHKQAKAHLNRHKGKKDMALDDEFDGLTDEELATLDPDFDDSHFVADDEAEMPDMPDMPEKKPKKKPMKEPMKKPDDSVDTDDNMAGELGDLFPDFPEGRAEIIAALRVYYTDLNRKWFTIKEVIIEPEDADGQPETVAEINIYDAIGSGISAKDFVERLASITASRINVRLNSPGGMIDDGIAIRNALARHSADVYTYVDGIAASMASVIALVGKEVVMEPDSMLMLHEPWGCAMGEAKDMEKQARILNKYASNIAGAYARKAGGTREEWRNVMREEGWYTPEEAVDAGLVDRVGDGVGSDPEMKGKQFDLRILSLCKNAPESAKRFFNASIVPDITAAIIPEKEIDASEIVDMVSGISSLTIALRSAQADNDTLRTEVSTKETELKTKESEITEIKAVVGELMAHVNKVLDTPMPRKTGDAFAEGINSLSEKYPWLDARIIAHMARDKEPNT